MHWCEIDINTLDKQFLCKKYINKNPFAAIAIYSCCFITVLGCIIMVSGYLIYEYRDICCSCNSKEKFNKFKDEQANEIDMKNEQEGNIA